MKLLKTIDFLKTYAFQNMPVLIDDCQPIRCKFCGKTAFMAESISHKRGCVLGSVMKEIKEAREGRGGNNDTLGMGS